jgi:hypothetical protein
MKKRGINVYKWLFFAVFCLLLVSIQPARAQTWKQEVVESFFKDLVDVDIPIENVIGQHMVIDTPAQKDSKARERHEFLSQQVYRLRMMMLGQSKKITNNFGNAIVAYNDLPENEHNIMIDARRGANIFRFKGEQGILLNILISGDRIASFTTMNKGGKQVFLML